MKKYLPYAPVFLVLAVVPFIPRGNASASPYVEAPPAPQALHPSRAVDAQGYFFAHDTRIDDKGAIILTTTVGAATITTSDGSRVAGGEIRTMEYQLVTSDIDKMRDDPTYYDTLVSGLYSDSIRELQFRPQLATYRQRAIDMASIRPGLALRILAGKNAPPPVINSTVVPPPTTGACSKP